MKRTVKRVLSSVLPASAMGAVLGIWRRCYWRQRRRIPRGANRRCVAALLAGKRPILLELGSARRPGMEDWVFSDINGGGDLRLELTEPLPFPDGSVTRIYLSHVLEHFSYPHPMLDLLRECHRMLLHGGTIDVAVPDTRIFVEAYLHPDGFDREVRCAYDVGLDYRAPVDYLNFIAYMGGDHRHLFDAQNLPLVLAAAGFSRVRLRDFDPALDLAVRRDESVYASAEKGPRAGGADARGSGW